MEILFDTHTHTLASDHAYTTVLENAKHASQMKMEAIAVTDHCVGMTDAPHMWHFVNLKNIPRVLYGVKILYGVELNILDPEGNVDMDDELMSKLDVVNASIHTPCYSGVGLVDHTKAYERVVLHPHIDIICHSGNPAYKYDYEKIIDLAKKNHKLMEINNHSFYVRKSSIENCRRIAEICKEKEVGIVVSSDAHFSTDIGEYSHALNMLKEISFPEKLIMNRNLDAYKEYVRPRKEIMTFKM